MTTSYLDSQLRRDYFALVPSAPLRDPKLSLLAKGMYAYLISYGNQETHTAWPGQRRIAEETQISARQVVRLLQELEKAGLIVKGKSGKGNCNEYRLPVPKKGESATESLLKEKCHRVTFESDSESDLKVTLSHIESNHLSLINGVDSPTKKVAQKRKQTGRERENLPLLESAEKGKGEKPTPDATQDLSRTMQGGYVVLQSWGFTEAAASSWYHKMCDTWRHTDAAFLAWKAYCDNPANEVRNPKSFMTKIMRNGDLAPEPQKPSQAAQEGQQRQRKTKSDKSPAKRNLSLGASESLPRSQSQTIAIGETANLNHIINQVQKSHRNYSDLSSDQRALVYPALVKFNTDNGRMPNFQEQSAIINALLPTS